MSSKSLYESRMVTLSPSLKIERFYAIRDYEIMIPKTQPRVKYKLKSHYTHMVMCHKNLNYMWIHLIWLTWHNTRAWSHYTSWCVIQNPYFNFQIISTHVKRLSYLWDVLVGVTPRFISTFQRRIKVTSHKVLYGYESNS